MPLEPVINPLRPHNYEKTTHFNGRPGIQTKGDTIKNSTTTSSFDGRVTAIGHTLKPVIKSPVTQACRIQADGGNGKGAVNTNVLQFVSKRIRAHNTKAQEAFKSVSNAMNMLIGAWNGQASTLAEDIYQKIKTIYTSHSDTIMRNHADYLDKVATPGYEQAEAINQKHSISFK